MARASIPPEEVRVLDVNSSYLGVRTITLMENAGKAVAEHVLSVAKPGSKVAIVCGKGNNGGDGFVAGRFLKDVVRTDIFLVEPREDVTGDIARLNLDRARDLVRPISTFDPKQYQVIVDAMLGAGLDGRPRDPYPKYIKMLNDSRRKVVSVDIPSGWPSDLHVHPDDTVTMHAPKNGMTSKNSGRIIVKDIGIPEEAELFCGPGDFTLLPRRRKDAHKGDAGRVLVVGGGPYTGAPAFTGMAAMRAGVDLVFVATPEASALPVSIYSPNMIVRSLKGDFLSKDNVAEVLELAKGKDVVAIGPGLGNDPETIAAIQEIIPRLDVPMVIDADAIAACGIKPKILRRKRGVITPHAGEFKKLTNKTIRTDDLEGTKTLVRAEATKLGMTILLKGPTDVLSDGTYVKLNRVHNDAMTVGGTGDVLTGAVAGFLAQKVSPFAAARIGAFTAGLAGNLAFEERSYGLVATDVIDKIPLVLRRYL